LGGIVEIRVEGLPYGLGTHTQWDKKLDGRLAQAVMAVQAMKGVEIGMGFQAARTPGSLVHDPIRFDPSQTHARSLGFTRAHNNAGGLEAGMTNSQPLVLRVAMKPISTLAKPLESVNLQTKQAESASYERSDVCAVAAASCILENVVAFEIACAVVEKFGGDHLEEIQQRLDLFYEMARKKLSE
jgi:chorismate synthase